MRFESLKGTLVTVGWLICLTLFVLVLTSFYFRRVLYQWQVSLDEGLHTQSDFCLMGRNIIFNDPSSRESMRKELQSYFNRKFGIEDFEYFTPAYKGANGK